MDLVFGFPGAELFLAERLPNCSRGFDNGYGLGIVEHGNLVAAIVYSGWQPESGVVEMSAAADTPRWLTRDVIRQAFAYPFAVLKCQLVVWRVSGRNTRARRLAERLGFAGYTVPRLRGREESEIIYTLTAEAWREGKHMGHRDAQTNQAAAAAGHRNP